jgi:NAD(P)-dependent dehydrogenase (short-subunit alcohol dehydrogenase family)
VLDLTGKVAFISGIGSVGPGWGNGRATAALLARQGASVFGTDIDAGAGEATRTIVEGEGGVCVVRQADMMASDSVAEAVAACLARFGRVDILVNNVGGSVPGEPATMAEADWERQIDYNLKTVFLTCKHVLPIMERQGAGAIVNLASVAALRDHVGRALVGYSASKAGVIAFTRSTAIAYAAKGIRANTVVPGLMHTPLVEHRLVGQSGLNDAAALIAKRNAAVPMGRMGSGWDTAHAVLFLVSDEARYITATEIVVDGGLTATMP